MRFKFNLLCFSLFLILSFFSCKKDPNNNKTNYDVYIAGTYQNNAAYWKNGILNKLGTNYGFSFGRGIAINADNVYVSGNVLVDDTATHTGYWKNGVFTDCGVGYGTSLAINNGNVYTGGYYFTSTTSEASIWKNGNLTDLGSGQILGISISGNDIYAVGLSESPGVNEKATYWVNNVPHYLQDGAITGIFVSGSDIYAIGFLYSNGQQSSCYWKNWQVVRQYNPQTIFNAIAVSGNDIYIAGYTYTPAQSAAYWKNGTLVNVNGATGLSGIAVANGEVYLTGDNQVAATNGVGDTWSALYINNAQITNLGITQGENPGIYPTSITLSPQ
jgi:hypothetical protein